MAARRRLGPDEAGAIQAVEAVLSAILILGALVFFALVQRTATPASDTGWDQEQVAADALAILQGGSSTNLQTQVLQIMGGGASGATAVTTLSTAITSLLPTGARWVLNFDNGFGQMALASSETGAFSQPRGGLGSEAFVTLTGWTGVNGAGILPGGQVTVPAGCSVGGSTLDAPGVGTTTGPQGAWLALLGGTGTQTVPASFPFGTWTFGGSGGCTGSFTVILGSTTAAVPLYGVHLVVWSFA